MSDPLPSSPYAVLRVFLPLDTDDAAPWSWLALDAAGQAEIIRLEQETIDPFRVAVEAGIAAGVFRPVPAELVAHNLKLAAHGWALKHWDVGARLDLTAYIDAELDLLLAAIRA